MENITRQHALIIFQQGLKEPLRTLVKSRNHADLVSAMAHAVAEDALGNPEERTKIRLKKNLICNKCGKQGHIGPKCFSKINFHNEKTNNLVNDKQENSQRRIICSNCKKAGHLSKDCKFEKYENKCFRCGKTGHISRNCKSINTIETKNELGPLKSGGSAATLKNQTSQWFD